MSNSILNTLLDAADDVENDGDNATAQFLRTIVEDGRRRYGNEVLDLGGSHWIIPCARAALAEANRVLELPALRAAAPPADRAVATGPGQQLPAAPELPPDPLEQVHLEQRLAAIAPRPLAPGRACPHGRWSRRLANQSSTATAASCSVS